jgi:hypothetical protein
LIVVYVDVNLSACGIDVSVERVVTKGPWGTVERAVDSARSLPARRDYEQIDSGRRAKMQALFDRLA